jgi:hypothetical protein
MKVIPIALILTTSLGLLGPLSAKERPDAEARKEERMERMHKAWLEQMQGQFQRRKTVNQTKMKLRLDFLERAIGLDDKQMETMILASKGAVERASQAWLDYHEKTWKAEQENRYSREQMDQNKVDPMLREIWTNALDKTLSPKQQRSYQREMGIRASYFGSAMLRLRLSAFDQQALLSRKQRDALTQKLEISFSIPTKDVTTNTVLKAVQTAYQRITPKDQQEILSTEQQAIWLQFLKNADRYSQSMEIFENDMLDDVVRGGGFIDF